MIIHNHYLFLFHIQQFKRCSCVESYEPDPATVGCYLRAPMVTVVSPNLTFSMHVLLVPQASRPYWTEIEAYNVVKNWGQKKKKKNWGQSISSLEVCSFFESKVL